MDVPAAARSPLRHRLHTVIFEADTPVGKAFDVALLLAIVASVVAVCLESVASIEDRYGDIAPTTVLGKFIASAVMILGYGIIAVPTGIVGVELHRASRAPPASTQACPACGAGRHATDARYCRRCGAWLHPEKPAP